MNFYLHSIGDDNFFNFTLYLQFIHDFINIHDHLLSSTDCTISRFLNKIVASAKISDVPELDLALVTVKVKGGNDFPPTFEQPDGYTFSVKEGGAGLSVGFVKVSICYAKKQASTSVYQCI